MTDEERFLNGDRSGEYRYGVVLTSPESRRNPIKIWFVGIGPIWTMLNDEQVNAAIEQAMIDRLSLGLVFADITDVRVFVRRLPTFLSFGYKPADGPTRRRLTTRVD